MSEIKLGMLGNQKVDIEQLKGGLKQANVSKSEHQLIFSKIDSNNNGIIEQEEMEDFTENLQKSAGNSRLNNREASKLLKNMGLEDTNATELFEFLQISAEQSKNIKSTKNIPMRGGTYAINIEYQPDKDGNISSSMYNADGKKISDTVKDKNFTELTTFYNDDGKTVSHYERKQGAVTSTYDTLNRLLKTETQKADGITDAVIYEYDGNQTEPYQTTSVLADGTLIVKADGYTTTFNADGSIDSDNPMFAAPEEQNEENNTQKLSNGRILTVQQDEDGNKITFIQENENSEPVQIKYDKDGNILSNAKEGETFARTAERLGIAKDSPEYEKFKELNSKAAKNGWFIVGAEVKIPAGMEEKINLEGLNVDVKSEIEKFKPVIPAPVNEPDEPAPVNTQPIPPKQEVDTPTTPTTPSAATTEDIPEA